MNTTNLGKGLALYIGEQPQTKAVGVVRQGGQPLAISVHQIHVWKSTAFDKWEAKTCLVFTEVSSPPRAPEPYIFIDEVNSQACYCDRMGINRYSPYRTLLNAGWCKNVVGSLAHEIGHALGLTHTQKRVDRDEHIRLYTDFLTAQWRYQYEPNDKNSFDDYGIPYYYDSLMHYPPTFTLDSTGEEKTTICARDPFAQNLMGQREQITHKDYALVNKMYCEESCVNRAELSSTTFDGSTLSQTLSGRICQKWTASSPHSHGFTSVGDHNYCRNPDRWSLGPWCYTTDPDQRYEPCVASCETLEDEEVPNCEGYCHNGGFFDSTSCNCVCPKATSGEHCETVNLQEKYAHVGCGGKIELTEDGAVQGIESPGYGSRNYGNNQMCKWWIKAPSGKSVAAEVENFHLEEPSGDSCKYDYLEILTSNCPDTPPSVKETRYCGQSLDPKYEWDPYIFKSDSEDLIITFSSDYSMTDKGFKIDFSVY